MDRYELLVQDAQLAQRLRSLSIEVLQEVYARNAERFDERRGDDRLTFGVTVWRNAWFALEAALQGVDGSISTARPHGSFRIRFGNLSIYVYKIGDTSRNELAAYQLEASLTKDLFVRANTDQLSLFDPPEMPVGAPVALVLGHAGNPVDGLTLLEIGLPARDADGRTRWEWTERFYIQEPGDAADGGGQPETFAPFDEGPMTEAELVLRTEEDEETES
jgi:hypothetical protein